MPKRRSRNATQTRKILAELNESGLSQREFARIRNIPLSTLSSWHHTFFFRHTGVVGIPVSSLRFTSERY